MKDKIIKEHLEKETIRQNEGIELIASENYPSIDVMEAQGSIFTAKYAEGYPGKRYYGGCEVVDQVESLAIERAKELFHAKFANVQPHSGSQANFAAYHALLNKGDKVLSLVLNDGGHLTHGSPVSFSSHDYQFSFYPLGEDGHIDLGLLKELLDKENPNLLLAGYSAYPYAIPFKKIKEIINAHNEKASTHCFFMVDMAHIAGIIAAGLCENPVDYADIVTSTTHKTLRGPRGGLILTNDEAIAKKVNSAIFPYSQGGPLEHVIAAKAVAFGEALHPEFKKYMQKVLDNTKACGDELASLGAKVSGTDNHLFLLDVLSSYGINGKEAQARLGEIGLTVNKNMIHGDTLSPALTSGIRVGFAALTSRGATLEDAKEVARIIHEALKTPNPEIEKLKERTAKIAASLKDVTSLQYPSVGE